MEYIVGMLWMILVGLVARHHLPQKWQTYMPYYWLGLVMSWSYIFLTRPYVPTRIIGDLVRLMA